MSRSLRTAVLTAIGVSFLALGTAAPAEAQMADDHPQWSVDGQAGIGLPVGDLSDLPIDDVGPAITLGVGYNLSPRFTIRGHGAVEIFGSEDEREVAPDVRLFHYGGGVVFDVIASGQSPFEIAVNAGGGATTFDTDAFSNPGGGPGEFKETYFSFNGGVMLGYGFTEDATVFVRGEWYQMFTDEDETLKLAQVSPELDEGFDSASSVPIQVGVNVGF